MIRHLLVLVVFLAAPAAAQPRGVQPETLVPYLEQARQDWEAPGLAVAIVKDDSVVFARGFGVRERGGTAPVDARTLFLLASTTKAFTAAALGLLVDEGRLKWDDPVTKYLPSFELQDPYVTREITIRDLLSHHTGLTRADDLWWASSFDRKEIVRRLRNVTPAGSFRATYGYNNNLFITAGEVVTAASGTTWDAFVRRRLLEPLGMRATNTSILDLPPLGNVATPHARLDGEVTPIPWRNFDNLGGAGSMNSSVYEMAQWLRMLLGGGLYEGRRILSEEVVRELQASQTVIRITEDYAKRYPSSHFRAYGLGWFLHDYRGVKVVQHSGSLDGMRARVGMIPERNLGVVLLTNLSESSLLEALLMRIFDAYLDAPPRDWSAELLAERKTERDRDQARQDSVTAARIPDVSPALPLSAYAGLYTHPLYGDLELTEEGGGLVLRFGPSYTGDLTPWHYETFRATWRDAYMGKSFITFTLNAAAKVETVIVEGLGTFKRP